MIKCPHCSSEHITTKHIRKNATGSSQRYKCNSCSKWFSNSIQEEFIPKAKTAFIKRFVITACQNNASVNKLFLKSLEHYCRYNDAELLIVPIVYRPDDHEEVVFNIPKDTIHTLVRHKMKIHDEVFVMGSFNFIPTAVNPLQGLESLSKGDTLIVPSPQLRMKSMAVSAHRHPAILHTTGAISNPEYTNTKVGEKALFNHSYSAVLIEVDVDNDFHIRVLNSDETGSFVDIGNVYTPEMEYVVFESPIALVTGDEHGVMADPVVERVTYHTPNSITRELRPTFVVRHDVLDASSISHHTRKDNIKNIGKYIFGTNKIEEELEKTVEYIKRTTDHNNFINVIVQSNHNSHLTRWFSEINIKEEPWNAKFYHKYMSKIIESMEKTDIGFDHIDPFEQYCKDVGLDKTEFLSRDTSFMVADVELGTHSDVGVNGTKGSINQFANLPAKYVIGHSHSPGIVFGAYQVGTSSYKKLDYTSGLSSWMHTHCLVYANGKRQLINIINGKWKA